MMNPIYTIPSLPPSKSKYFVYDAIIVANDKCVAYLYNIYINTYIATKILYKRCQTPLDFKIILVGRKHRTYCWIKMFYASLLGLFAIWTE